jgi:hypothetical protein
MSASFISRALLKRGPTIWGQAGNPSSVSPEGTERAGIKLPHKYNIK